MGTGSSKEADEGSKERVEDQAGGGQLYVSLKMENSKLTSQLVPHVYGSLPLVGSWDPSKALSMERESVSMWELSFVVPPNHETLDFKFLLKPKHSDAPCFVEEGPTRLLIGGALGEDAKHALFRIDSGEVLEYQVFVKADRVSPFDLAASWRAYQDNFRPSAARWVPDITINSAPQTGGENGSSAGLELDLEHYVVPAPSTSTNSSLVYAANMTENPRSLLSRSGSNSYSTKEMEVIVPDPSKVFQSSGMVESKSVGTFSPMQRQESQKGLFVDRGVGSPRLVKSSSSNVFTTGPKNSMPAAAGAVAAAAVADQMLGLKEDRHLAIVLVGLPARGKTFTAAKLTRYLRWLGHDTKHFNVGKYRRLKHGANQAADFFRADNPEGMEARNEVAALAFEDMLSWMQEGGQVGIFDATNSDRKRRNMLMKLAEGKCKIIFLETICNDVNIIERNIRLKIQQSPDYAEEPDFETGLQDFKNRLANYERVYETVEEGSYIKMIDKVSGHGGQIQVNNISGYLPGRIVFFLVNTHLTPRPILLTQHGESQDNVRGRIGGDTAISEAGELYSKKLANFVGKRLKSERAASVGSVIKNPEIAALVPTLLKGLSDPNEHTKYSLDILLQTTFVNSIDAPSLALLVPIVHRGLRERSADTKKRASQIVGNMCSLVTEPKDMIPYIGLLLPEVKKVLVDPIPEVRSVAARAIGSLIGGMGEENFPDLVPWLFETLKSDNSNVERSGAAQGLSEVLAALGIEFFEHVLPDIIRNCSHQKASVRDGYLTLFKYLPRSLGVQFQNYLQQVLPAILDGLADENESVREAALGAGHVLVEHYATTSLPLLLPTVEDGIFNDNWRIRQSSVELLGDLLFKVAGTSGKALLEGGSDDEGSSTEAHGRAIIEVLGRDKRNEVLAALYMVRTDVSLSVRQAALHVWKTIVANTPKTLREIMPVLMDTLIASLASTSSERRQVAGRSLGELVRKLGERVLPWIIPILSQGLNDPDSSKRQGVCVGLSEVMASAGKNQLLTFMNELIPTIRTALCDSEPAVRESAGLAFSTLYKSAGLQAIDEIVPTLLHALEDDKTSDTALDGLKQILSVRTSALLPHILPKLVHPPLSAFNAHALGALAEVAGPGLDFHLGTVLPPLLSAMADDDEELQTSAKESAQTIVLVIDEEGVEPLISELVKGVGDSQAAVRRSSSYLIGYFFKNSKLYLVDEAPNMISTLIVLLSDPDSSVVTVAWEALSRVIVSVPKDVLPSYIKLVRDAVSTSRDKERRKKKGGPVLIPGFSLPKALQPILPIFLQGLISGSAELREQAALGLGELIEVTSEKSLKEFVIPITGPLIRIIGDRFPWQVKSAILSTLTIMIRKGGISLKPFLPQLQTTFVKCLQDSTRTVRSGAAQALGMLSGLSTRVDPLVSDLLSSLQVSDGGVREAILSALKGVLKHAGKNVSSAVRDRIYSVLKDLIHHDDDRVRMYAASILGVLTQYLEAVQLTELIQELSSLANSSSWPPRHGSILTISSLLYHNPAPIFSSSLFQNIVDCLRHTLKDEKFPLRETSTKALGRLLLYRTQTDPSDTLLYKDVLSLLVASTHDDSSEVRRRALSAIKAVAKANPSAIMSHGTLIGPSLAECLKDANTPVRLAAERCAVHAFQLTKGSENVQAVQKYITGLDARRLSKFPEYSDDSEDGDEDISAS